MHSVVQFHMRTRKNVRESGILRLRGGGATEEESNEDIIEEDGMFKLGDFLFHTKVANPLGSAKDVPMRRHDDLEPCRWMQDDLLQNHSLRRSQVRCFGR